MAAAIKERVRKAWEQRPPSMRTRPRPARPQKAKRPRPQARPQPDAGTGDLRELRAQRDRLVERFTVMQADLGGAFYEMAIRDHVRIDVLTRKAAELQRVDAELATVEATLELERAGAAGICPSCSAPFATGTRFCGQCGTPLTTSPAVA